MSKYLLPLVLFGLTPAAHAQVANCPDSWSISQNYSTPREAFDRIHEVCHPGDRILVENHKTGLVMLACDPGKPISTVGTDVMCTLPAAAAPTPVAAVKKLRH